MSRLDASVLAVCGESVRLQVLAENLRKRAAVLPYQVGVLAETDIPIIEDLAQETAVLLVGEVGTPTTADRKSVV